MGRLRKGKERRGRRHTILGVITGHCYLGSTYISWARASVWIKGKGWSRELGVPGDGKGGGRPPDYLSLGIRFLEGKEEKKRQEAGDARRLLRYYE